LFWWNHDTVTVSSGEGRMILLVGGVKGGSGKTLLVSQLTAMRARAGADVLLIDSDEQGSAMDFTRQRQRWQGRSDYTAIETRQRDVAVQVQRMADKYTDILIDVGGRDSASQRAALTVADVILIPFLPTSVDLWTADMAVVLLTEAREVNPGLRACAMLNRLFPRGQDNTVAADALQHYPEVWTYLDTPLGMRKAFSSAFGGGYTVQEYGQKDRKAIAEITALYDRLFQEGDTHGH
jgi:chromosome partitioning protein